MNTIMEEDQLKLTLKRLAHEIIENHYPFSNTCIIGIQPRGIAISDFITQYIQEVHPEIKLQYGKLDITFYRDDFRTQIHVPNITDLPFSIENKKVVLIDDVLYTGRTIRAAMDALLDHGRAKKVELCILVDRKFSRELPIQPDYFGKSIDSIVTQKVKVIWDKEKKVVLYDSI
ncbi:MAG: bifunctional pyr operon transcriptional regulator/uracil phosphoribosyltransferase [Chitinophagaceae bacterium]|nr:MAG: bifunctional pyr operon transcriptional regulator/uracil phosphoribosyltransferase [Chitinophagaceae bacterium]